MPYFPWSQLIAAGATFNPLDGWMFEYPPRGGRIDILNRATAIGCVQVVTAGSDTLMEESPVQAGGTAGTTPSTLNTPPISEVIAGGDRLKIKIRNTTGGGITVDGLINYDPAA